MKTHPVTTAIPDINAISHDLHTVRKRYRNDQITKAQFLLSSAESYLALQKPLRATALLEIIVPHSLTSDQIITYTSLLDKCNSFRPSATPVCSLNMIVKNEEDSIGKALDSIDLLMDEIVICDTGSSDLTVEVAEQYGVKIIYDQWQNDFSRARNRAIEASTGDWILWMDADDRLEVESVSRLSDLWQSKDTFAAAFCIVNERDNASPVEFLQVRLFPRLPGIGFEQCIHEQVMYSIARKDIPFIVHQDIRIRHTGYMNRETQQEKSLRNRPMILSELRKRPDDPVLLFNLGDCLLTLNHFEEALQAYQTVTQNKTIQQKNPDVFIQAHINCANILIHQERLDEAEKQLLQSLDFDRTRIEAHFALGRLYFKKNSFQQAFASFMESARTKPPLRMTAIDTTRIRLESIYYLTDILLRWQRFSEAENLLLPAIKINPLVPQYHMLMGKVLLGQNRLQEAAHYFTASISLAPDNNSESYKGMADVYQIIGDAAMARKYSNKVS